MKQYLSSFKFYLFGSIVKIACCSYKDLSFQKPSQEAHSVAFNSSSKGFKVPFSWLHWQYISGTGAHARVHAHTHARTHATALKKIMLFTFDSDSLLRCWYTSILVSLLHILQPHKAHICYFDGKLFRTKWSGSIWWVKQSLIIASNQLCLCLNKGSIKNSDFNF